MLQSSRQRSERLIVLGRAVLAGFSLLAIWLDPSEPAKYAQATYSLLAAYLAYALLLTAWAWTAGLIVVRVAPVTHAIDGLIFTALIYLTEGPTSPFFVFFVFTLFAAALRWQWQGVLWTAFAILVIYLGLGIYVAEIARDPGFELNRFMIRSVYLAVVAVLLAYLSAHEQLLRKELADLAAWPRHIAPGSLVEAALRHAAIILGAQRLVMVWRKVDEPGRCRAEPRALLLRRLREVAAASLPRATNR